MSFTSGLPWTATEADLKARWSCGKPGEYFRCGFCGHKFKVGDVVRWQYTNDTPGAGGNPFVCQSCDAPHDDLIAKWKAMYEEAKTRMWWFNRHDT